MTKKGFKANWKVVTATEGGSIKSEGFPNNYPNDKEQVKEGIAETHGFSLIHSFRLGTCLSQKETRYSSHLNHFPLKIMLHVLMTVSVFNMVHLARNTVVQQHPLPSPALAIP